ncbi:MAG: histidine kinase, partial [Bacteroidia bacterium]|nr:histidine kinase [Bacteroidia bacterium]
FGGPHGKKFMAGNFKRLLEKISTYDSFKQKEVLNTSLIEWQGVHEQVDDVLVIGVKMT